MLRPRCSSCVTALVIAGGPLLAGGTTSAQEIERGDSTDIGSMGTSALVGSNGVLYDNGPPDGLNGFSNATSGVFGSRRTVLDDFAVPPEALWTLRSFRWQTVWDSLPAGSGTGAEFFLRADDAGTPGEVLLESVVTSYSETGTGEILFSRPVAESWITMEPISLGTGTYWFEATIVGPENNFWLTADVLGTPCWVNYEDFAGLEPGVNVLGEDYDLNFQLLGDIGCPADVNGDDTVDFGDLQAVLAAWGVCEGCPEDLDGDGFVGMQDILRVLARWGPCPEPGMGACCLPDGTCLEETTPSDCEALGGNHFAFRTCAVIPCLGACCFDDGTCIDVVAEGACESMDGFFQGPGSTCAIDCQTGACCFDDGTCVAAIEEACATLGGTYRGDGSTCAATCLGACCFADATCDEAAAEGECVAAGGFFRGAGSTCAADCRTGACCLDDGTCVEEVIVEVCGTMGGAYRGDDTTCVATCLGACCFPDAVCDEATAEGECVAAGGFFRGAGTTCAVDCRTGACCFEDGSCVDEMIVDACGAMGGTYQGDGSTCAATCLGACCFDDGFCVQQTAESECVTQGGRYRGDGSNCNGACRTGACCFGDGVCLELIVEACAGMGGTYVGEGVQCEVLCLGACCFEDFTCLEEQIEDDCLAAGGSYRGQGTTCAVQCPSGACCLDEICIQSISSECGAMGGSYRGNGTTCATRCDYASDTCADAPLRSEGSYYYSTIGATTDGPALPPECDEGNGLDFEKDVWFRYQSSCDGTATASVCESNFRTRLAIYDDGDCPGPIIACNEDACGIGGTRSEVSFTVEADGVYLIRIGSRTGSIGSGTLVLRCDP